MIAATLNAVPVRLPAIAAAIGMIGLALFQVALAAGAPLGRAAWGGTHAGSLPAELRTASAVAVLIWSAAAVVVLRRGGLGLLGVPEPMARWGTWVLFGVLLLGAMMNIASSSPWERYLWGPYALTLAGLCFLVAHDDGT
jgi:hypothetical protein